MSHKNFVGKCFHTSIGDFKIEQVLIYYDGPRSLKVTHIRTGHSYLALDIDVSSLQMNRYCFLPMNDESWSKYTEAIEDILILFSDIDKYICMENRLVYFTDNYLFNNPTMTAMVPDKLLNEDAVSFFTFSDWR